MSLPNATSVSFSRAIVSTNSQTTNETASAGADVFGYDTIFGSLISQLPSISIGDFSASYPLPAYIPQLDWDPTTAQYWTNFNIDPAIWNLSHNNGTNSEGQRSTDYRLNSNEFAIFMTNGFVVSERLGDQSFAQVYYKLLSDEMPVFVSADSVLQAWHRTYDNMLEEMEELELAPSMEEVITNMALQVPQAAQLFANAAQPLSDSVQDADFFLTVALSLWAGQQVPNYTTGSQGVAVSSRVNTALGDVQSLIPREINQFGTYRPIDFRNSSHADIILIPSCSNVTSKP